MLGKVLAGRGLLGSELTLVEPANLGRIALAPRRLREARLNGTFDLPFPGAAPPAPPHNEDRDDHDGSEDDAK